MTIFDEPTRAALAKTQGGLYVRLEPDCPLRLVAMGPAVLGQTSYDPVARAVNYDPAEGKTTLAVPVYDFAAARPRVLSRSGKRFVTAFVNHEKDGHDPSAEPFEIMRTGSGFDTNYVVRVAAPMSDAEAQAMAAEAAIDLAAAIPWVRQMRAPAGGYEPGGPRGDDDIPF